MNTFPAFAPTPTHGHECTCGQDLEDCTRDHCPRCGRDVQGCTEHSMVIPLPQAA